MIRITFKNVGQGDSIIIEWEQNKKIAIIDCKKAFKTNPVLDYIKEKDIKEISFILLSHPHLDHCSGFTELIDYCISHNVKIKYFLHTSNNMPSFWKAAVDGGEAKAEIIRLFKIIREAYDKIGMKSHQIQAEMIGSDNSLDGEYYIKIVAPTSKHLDNYAKNFTKLPFEEESGNKPSANWLATAIKIYSNKHDGFILLSSDANKDTMFYNVSNPENFEGKLILAQCPHHGAEGNYSNAFWKLIKKSEKTPIVLSVGDNIYNHPAKNVIKHLKRNNYTIFSTNQVGGLSDSELSIQAKVTKIHISTFGEFVPISKRDNFNGDKIFEIDSAGNVLVV